MMDDDVGAAAEHLVARICARAFFSDFVVRNPKFRFEGGTKEHEAADVLILFGSHLLSIQVKARGNPRKEAEAEDVYAGRLVKRIGEGARQVGTTLRALRANALSEVTTERGITVPVPPSALDSVRGIVVLDLPAERSLRPPERSVLFARVSEEMGVPVHAFLSDEFDVMLDEIDTLPDFLDYLAFREALLTSGKLSPHTRNLDLLAAYRIHFELRSEARQAKFQALVVEDGLWEEYEGRYGEARRRRAEANKRSYVVDRAIDFLHASFAEYGQEHALDWYRMVYELANLRRTDRRHVGERWHAAIHRAANQPYAFSVCMIDDRPGEAIIVYAGPEEGRADRLWVVAAATYVRWGLRRVRAFGTAPANAGESTMQMALLEDIEFGAEERARLDEAATALLGPKKQKIDYEYGNTPDTRKASKRFGSWDRGAPRRR